MRAIASETKGAVADFVKFLFVGRFRLRCDNEHLILAKAEKVKAKMWKQHRDTAQQVTVSQIEQPGQLANK